MSDTTKLTISIDDSLLTRIDAELERMRRDWPLFRHSRASVVRSLILRGLQSAAERARSEEVAANVKSQTATIRVFHRTNRSAADAILGGGFRDARGSYMCEDLQLEGVFVSDAPLSINEGAKGAVLLAVDLAAPLDDHYELVEDEKPYREWCVPAAVLNAGVVTEVEED